ncbi:antifreeze protein [Flavobacterium branchiophilum]|uniref:Membrane protease subunit (Stomatin/prohibitin family) n=1 Tax=Flavobacterium branchiophilum TaxID=55197 RepID=A0A543G1Y1_9FLAO|nr:SPFH domain-containing protein [Flavobacterium branchiophilum]OXA73791.1 antifreeze protein [Flavobacterium branchiophilum] [Flavobacterium branchiophilum NBRC 15030 = ATCC 35035]TQM40081.1 membrane protease subunit (stomatin/prohibitin family) [Flavobacterium branchiophilum]GEM55925.1 antifreeze protein, type I [Flavobacterium branchiophilum NBRC 15030 = ATCC 35035]
MGIFDKLRNEFIDIIECIDQGSQTIVWRFERYQNEIKNDAKLIVREGQQAVFINEGTIADVFLPGTYTLNTQNLPLLSTLQGWKYGFNSPFKAEVYFVSTRQFIDQKWGTKNAITLNDDRFGMLEIRAYGNYCFRITDAGKFIKEIVGTEGVFTTDAIGDQLRTTIVTRFTDAIGEAKIPVESYAANLNELSQTIFSYMQDDFAAYGMEVSQFLLENVSMPDEIKKEIFELSRLNKIDITRLTQYKTAQAIEAAAQNPSGVAGAGVGMGAGFAMGNQMNQAFNTAQNPVSPPPLPSSVAYFVALNGQQAGPFAESQLLDLIQKGQLNTESLIWFQGASGWQKAGLVAAISGLFSQSPPPLPNV